jgi:predicted RNase H-like HicB family nuclease
MKCKSALECSEESCGVSVPGQPGCWSQGATEAECPANFRTSILVHTEVRRLMNRCIV